MEAEAEKALDFKNYKPIKEELVSITHKAI